ncbi:hypothetical protein BDF20DRAFT_908537 [Mycotypha africana]|uniref:uncharacterized protein n=1 Tax=Mycotypha africana TaxID=64632 RepID=UPI00230149C4|nr:uncharacterized protein BDF20DRAFT_908537 [Mycotypha africana]KAI8967096.1 hypothetical protein BDF20DRAFT_908537 [Mycotypha africana]
MTSLFLLQIPMLVMLFINVGLSLAIFYVAKRWLSVLVALILSGMPPLLRVLYVFYKRRKFDILGILFVASFTISAVVSVISGDARLALLRDSATTGIISVLFFLTLIPPRTRWFYNRPLVFLMYSQMTENVAPKKWTDEEGGLHSMSTHEWVWAYFPLFRIYCYLLSGLWGFVLMGEFISKVIMIEATQLDVDRIVLYGQIIVIVVTVTMTVGTVIASRLMTKRMAVEAEEWFKQNDYSDRLSIL